MKLGILFLIKLRFNGYSKIEWTRLITDLMLSTEHLLGLVRYND